MAIIGIGIDLVKISRMEKIRARWHQHFLDRVFTAREQHYCLQYHLPHIHFSGRFAIKEALLKALGTGLRGGIRWIDIEVANNQTGKPLVQLTAQARKYADDMGVKQILSSISHDHDYAIAQVILEGQVLLPGDEQG